VNGDVQSKELDEAWIIAKPKQGGEIPGIILLRVDGRKFPITIYISINASGNVWNFSNPSETMSMRIYA